MEDELRKIIVDFKENIITFVDESGKEKKVKLTSEWLSFIDALIYSGKIKLKDIEVK